MDTRTSQASEKQLKLTSSEVAEAILSNDTKSLVGEGWFKDDSTPPIKRFSAIIISLYWEIRYSISQDIQRAFPDGYGLLYHQCVDPAKARTVFQVFDDGLKELRQVHECHGNLSPERTLGLTLLFHFVITSLFTKHQVILAL
jgi:hypothetical protein